MLAPTRRIDRAGLPEALAARFDAAVERYRNAWEKLDVDDRERFRDEILVVRHIYATNTIEGSKLTEEEVARVLGGGSVPEPLERDARETLNLKRAQDYIAENVGRAIDDTQIKALHSILVRGSWDEIAGKWREVNVRVGRRAVKADCKDVPRLVSALLADHHGRKAKDRRGALEAAVAFHVRFEEIHPFRDGNGRVGRLLFDWMMAKSGLPMLVLSLEDIDLYYDGLQSAMEGDYGAIHEFFVKCYERLADEIGKRTGRRRR